MLIILSCVLWALSILALRKRQVLAPALSFCALLLLSFITSDGYPVLPINSAMLISWLCMTLVVVFIIMLETDRVRQQTRGTSAMVIGGITGLALGLLGYTLTDNLSARYALMALSVIAGIYFGFLVYTRTPEGNAVRIGSGNFFKYLLAKGFPTAITLMQAGVALVLAIALYLS